MSEEIQVIYQCLHNPSNILPYPSFLGLYGIIPATPLFRRRCTPPEPRDELPSSRRYASFTYKYLSRIEIYYKPYLVHSFLPLLKFGLDICRQILVVLFRQNLFLIKVSCCTGMYGHFRVQVLHRTFKRY